MLRNLMFIFSCVIMLVACENEYSRGECSKDYERLKQLVSYGEVEDHVTLQLYDMQYACGECLSLYRVDKIIYSESGEYEYYFNKEIKLNFLNGNLEDKFNKFVCDSNKYNYIFSGDFRRNSLGVGRLDVTEGNFVCID
ncbi:hypothetical protein [Leminorella grimontii]|uniref:hypothetical protein n=1 Tax=Leminorella grimontii TaxID=82981 RepID=UPI00207F3944|nr:hypothetical protein [Leminorella grimontii]GKX61164.1 hypothetical protein SOASR031_34790 [Leminorella grimontii]